jgi:hypothetical protein
MLSRGPSREPRRGCKIFVVVAIVFDEFDLLASWHSPRFADSCLTPLKCLTLTRASIAALVAA